MTTACPDSFRLIVPEMFDPQEDIDTLSLALMFESVSPVFIKANSRPLIFINNTFEENIGTNGGAINILSTALCLSSITFLVRSTSVLIGSAALPDRPQRPLRTRPRRTSGS